MNENKINLKINTQFIKLNQALKLSGIAYSGGHANDCILSGLVYLNGAIELKKGKKLVNGDIIKIFETTIEVKS